MLPLPLPLPFALEYELELDYNLKPSSKLSLIIYLSFSVFLLISRTECEPDWEMLDSLRDAVECISALS